MKLLVMTKPTFFVEEDKLLSALFDEGVDGLHINKPGSAPMYSERLLTLLPEECLPAIVVHDHFYLKEEYGLRGIHFNDDDTIPPIGYKGYTSRTCHSFDQILKFKKNSQYVFLSDAFNGKGPSLSALEEASSQGLIDKKVYAAGGITVETIKTARQLGFGGVVVCGDLWSHFDIHSQSDYKELINQYGKLRKAAY